MAVYPPPLHTALSLVTIQLVVSSVWASPIQRGHPVVAAAHSARWMSRAAKHAKQLPHGFKDILTFFLAVRIEHKQNCV